MRRRRRNPSSRSNLAAGGGAATALVMLAVSSTKYPRGTFDGEGRPVTDPETVASDTAAKKAWWTNTVTGVGAGGLLVYMLIRGLG